MRMPISASSPATVLVVDDEAHVREVTAMALKHSGHSVVSAAGAEQAMEILREENIDVIISDVRMPGLDGIEFLRRVREEQPGIRFVVMTAHGTLDVAVRALRHGADDFLTKPFDHDALRDIVRRLLREVPRRPAPVRPGGAPAEAPLGESPPFVSCLDIVRKAARTDATVLITGETGSGKEVIARHLHALSPRAAGPFIAVNCGAIPENLIEAELFGYVRGAFSGAISDRPGKLALADGGTLFLDEVGEMPPAMQVKLLRVLQERVLEPVGGIMSMRADFRLVAATHRDLRAEVASGRFREDLWFRLHVIPVAVPPLRDRGDDVLLLARRFLAGWNAHYGTVHALSPGDAELLRTYAWPGNVRELANSVERAVVLAGDAGLAWDLGGGGGPDAVDPSVRGCRRAAEREAIVAALESCRWNKTRAAEVLGISRRSLLYKVKEYGIS